MSKWEWKKLKDICEIEFGTRVVRKKDGGSIYPVYGGGGATFKMDSFNREDCLIVSRFAMSPQCTRIVKGKFFLNDSGLSLKSKDLSVLSEQYLNSIILGINDDIYALGRGAAQRNLNVEAFKELNIPIPPLSEQKRIVKFLDEEFLKIDTLKTNAETNLKNAKELFETTLEKELNPLSRHSERSEESDADLPSGWEWKTLGNVCEILSDLINPTEEKYLNMYHVGGANIESETGRIIDLKTSEEEGLTSGKFVFDDSVVLYNKIRPYLKKVARPNFAGICSADMYPLSPKNGMLKDFLYYILISSDFTDYAIKHSDRAGMPKLNRKALFVYEFPLPPLSVQKEIVARLDKLSENVKRLEANYKQIIANCDELKKTILKQTFQGGD